MAHFLFELTEKISGFMLLSTGIQHRTYTA